MTKKRTYSSPLIIFYLLVSYIVIQLTWWGYLIYSLTDSVYKNKEIFNRKIMMIIGEGGVFFVLLILGILKFRKAIHKEFDLAQQKNNFLLSVTHELKSPLTAIKLYLQTLEKRNLEKEQKNKAINKALSETDRLSLLVENIILATKIEDDSFPVHIESINLSEYLSEIINDISQTKGNNHNTVLNIDDNIELNTDKLAFYSIVSNVYENALKYSPSGSEILVSLDNKKDHLIVKIADEGIGINERNKIFMKFYREGNEEIRKTKGTGLGLYIVKQLVSILRGEITVQKNNDKGSIFEIKLLKQ